jgi:tetratricopeptide (TPR) repeat protein
MGRPSLLFVSLWTAALILAFASGCRRDVEQSLTRAVEAWDSGDYKLAAEEYERYLYHHPTGEKASEARFQLANIYYFKLRRYDQARANYTAFLEHNPSHANAQVARERLAEVLGEMGRSYEAIAEYENLNPQDASERRRIRLRIADLYFAQRNYSQALTEYEKVIEKVPYDELSEQAYLREASIYHIERSQYQQALPVYQTLASTSGDMKVRIRARYGLADCYAGLYQFDEAIKTLRAIKDDAEQADVARRVAELEQQKREAAQASNGSPASPMNTAKARPVATEASKSENPEAVKSEKPETAKADQKEAGNRRKIENAKAENSNTVKQSKSGRATNTQTENSNKADKSKSPKIGNVK